MTDALFWLLRHDDWLQGFGVLASLIGVGYALWLAGDLYRVWASQTDPLLAEVTRLHLLGHSVMLTMQLVFGVINILVLTLPPIPLAYMASEAGMWTLAVITGRKVLRNALVLLMTVWMWYYAERRHVLVLRLQNNAQDGTDAA